MIIISTILLFSFPTFTEQFDAMIQRSILFTTNRIAAALLGGYAFTWGFTVFGMAGLTALGVDFHEAETGILLLAFLVFLVLFLWAFAASNILRVWAVLGGGAALMTAAAWALQRALLN